MARDVDLQADLAELAASIPSPEPRHDLGNIPDDDAPRRAETPEAPPQGAAEPSEPEPSDPAAAPASSARLEELERQVQLANRELEFVRRGQQPAPVSPPPLDPVAQIDQYLGAATNIRPEDLQTMLNDPEKGAEYFKNYLRVATAAGAAMATQQMRQEIAAKDSAKNTADSLREEFWSKNSDLTKVADLVQMQANQVYQEFAGRASNQQLVAETSRRVRARCDELGIKLDGESTPQRPQRIRPATAEMGGGSRSGNGKTQLSKVEADILDMWKQ